MDHESFLKELLKDKVPKMTEVEIHAFEYCNLSCSFCGQDHDSKVGMNSIPEKAQQVIEFIKNSPLDSHVVNFMGGEIFNDEIDDAVIYQYYQFYKTIRDACYDLGKTFRINFVTNLIFTKNRESVDWLLSKTPREEVMLSTSYDFSGRGLDINRSLVFKKNLVHYKNRIGVVGFVLTRPAIKKLLADKDKFFKEVLYEQYSLYFDWYVPEQSAEKMMPSEQEMLDGMLYVASHYPKIEPIKSMLENEHNEMTCFSLNKTTISPDGSQRTCRYLDYDQSQFETEIDYSTNAGIIQSHLDRHDCLSCEWYQRCQLRCFVAADWKDQVRMDTCFIKEFFNQTVGNKQ